MELSNKNQTQMVTPMTMDSSGRVVVDGVCVSESLSEVV